MFLAKKYINWHGNSWLCGVLCTQNNVILDPQQSVCHIIVANVLAEANDKHSITLLKLKHRKMRECDLPTLARLQASASGFSLIQMIWVFEQLVSVQMQHL